MEFRARNCIDRELGLLLLDYKMGWMPESEALIYQKEHLSKCLWCKEDAVLWDLSMEAVENDPSILNLADQRPTRVPVTSWKLATSAAMIVLVVLGFLGYCHKMQKENLEPMHYGLERASFVPINWRDSITVSGFSNRAQKAYAERDYQAAAENLKKILEVEPAIPVAHYNLGVVYLLATRHPEAIAELRTSLDGLDESLKESAHWYLAISYLRAGQIENCRSELTNLARSKGPYAIEANRVLKNMK